MKITRTRAEQHKLTVEAALQHPLQAITAIVDDGDAKAKECTAFRSFKAEVEERRRVPAGRCEVVEKLHKPPAQLLRNSDDGQGDHWRSVLHFHCDFKPIKRLSADKHAQAHPASETTEELAACAPG